MHPVNIALLSLTIGVLMLHLNWLPAFGWFFLVNTLIIVFVALLIAANHAKYRALMVLLSFILCLIPLSILAFSVPAILDSIESTKTTLSEVNPFKATPTDYSTIDPEAPSQTQSSYSEEVAMVFVDG